MNGVRLGLAFVVLALALPVSAQEPPVPSPSTLVEEVEVIGRLPGPAMWRVSTPTSQIWFLALPGGMPQGFKWNTARVAKALDGARELVLPPVATMGIGDMVRLLLSSGHLVYLPSGQTVRSDMPADLRARWEQAVRTVGQMPEHYDHFRPVVAAVALSQDAGKAAKLDPSGGRFQIAVVAKLHKVKIRNLASYRVLDLARGLSETPDDVSRAPRGGRRPDREGERFEGRRGMGERRLERPARLQRPRRPVQQRYAAGQAA